MVLKNSILELLLFRIAVVLLFLGRAWQHWFYDAPYRELLWDQERMQPFIENWLKIDWSTWVTNPLYDAAVASFINGMAVFYLVCAFSVLFYNWIPRISKVLLWAGAVSLFILSGLYFKSKSFQFGQFIEYALQFSAPVFFLFLARNKSLNDKWVFALKIAVALTFVGHGLYAVNFHPRPANFLVMCINILGVSESQATVFLNIAGGLDFAIAIAIFLPFRKIVFAALVYATFWGFATAMARPWAYFYLDFWQDSLHRWIFEAAYRVIHGVGPLVLAIYYWRLIWGKEKALT